MDGGNLGWGRSWAEGVEEVQTPNEAGWMLWQQTQSRVPKVTFRFRIGLT